MEIKSSKYDSIIRTIKNQPIIAVIMIVGVFVIGLASFTGSFKSLVTELKSTFELTPNDILGYWVIEKTDKTPKTYLIFKELNNTLYGTTKLLFPPFAVEAQGMPVTASMYDISLTENDIKFKTKRTYTSLRTVSRGDHFENITTKHNMFTYYHGSVEGNQIRFILSSDENYIDECIANRIEEREAIITMKSEFEKLYVIPIE